MKWSRGAPPEEGWYACKFHDRPWLNAYRWWDGKRWSWAAFPHEKAERAAFWATKKEAAYCSKELLWSVPCLTNPRNPK
jgi:hypothetical protein